MTRSRTLALVAAVAAAAAAVGAPPAAGAQPIEILLPLRADFAGLDRVAVAVSTPGSLEYRRFIPVVQLASRFGASGAARRRVVAFLRSAGATSARADATGLFVEARMDVSLAERLFGTALIHRSAAHSAGYLAPASPARVPAGLRGLVAGVVGLDTRPLARHLERFSGSAGVRGHEAGRAPSSVRLPSGTARGCAAGVATGGFTPNQYLTAYGFDPLRAAGFAGRGERVAVIEIDGFKRRDIRRFAHCFGLRLPRIDSFGVGVRRALAPGGETTLDIETLDAAAPGLASIDVYESSADTAHILEAFLAPLQNPGFKPQVISASLGLCEPFVMGSLGAGGLRAAQAVFALAAASGISFLAASGDSGSADCVDGNGVPFHRLAVNFPASSPWITSVGGTNLVLDAANAISSEVVWNDAGDQPGSAGGGGESMLFGRPGYQSGVVARNRRAQPDVSMLADVAPGYAVYCTAADCMQGGQFPWQTVGGTSAATPLLAGGVALVDQALRMHGLQDLGAANPLLYSAGRNPVVAAQVFHDVNHYGNDVGPFVGNHLALGCCSAASGYDEASGWGSLNLSAFEALALLSEPRAASVALRLPRHQHPIRRHAILAGVWCSGGCRIGAFAQVWIARQAPFYVHARTRRLSAPGTQMLALRFTAGQLRRLRAAVRHHRRVVARVFAVTLDSRGFIQRETGGTLLVLG